jgi:mannose-6-phosphate isomerase-like protein (cupin superfamily)
MRIKMKKRNAIFLAFVAMFALSASAQLPGLPEIDQEAPLDEPVTISKEILAAAFGRINDEDIPTTRMLEGGEFNVNIRHIGNVTMSTMRMLTHPDTIDVWVVQAGSGILNTGGELVDGVLQGGEEQIIEAGDIIYIPAGLSHGIKEAELITWFNIRFPEHRNNTE